MGGRRWAAGVALVLPAAACGGGGGPEGGGPPPGCTPSGTALSISASNLSFGTDCLAAPAGTPFTLEFRNEDPGVPHNVAIYEDESGATGLFRGETFEGVDTVTYEVPALARGTYFFRCDVHPQQMTGTLVVG